jgi:hypothetical protein
MDEDSMQDSSVEPIPQWYKRTGWRFGSMHLHVTASIFHVAICITPLGAVLFLGEELLKWSKGHPWIVLMWISVVALGYPTWAWVETLIFEKWVRNLPEAQRKIERAHYQLHAGMAKNFWQAVMQMYAVASLIGIALKNN